MDPDEIEESNTNVSTEETTDESPGEEAISIEDDASEANTEEDSNIETESKTSVPLKALQDERAKRQVVENRLDEVSKKFDRVLEALIASQPKPEEKEAKEEIEIPDYNVDPLGHLRITNELLRKQLEGLSNVISDRDKQSEVTANQSALNNRWLSDINTYSLNVPDVHEAFKFLANQKAEELKELGYEQQEILGIISEETRELVQRAYKKGANPVDILYKHAGKRGYKVTQVKGNGAEKRDVKSARGFEKPGTTGQPITADAITNMTEDQFEDFMKNKDWKQLHRKGLI